MSMSTTILRLNFIGLLSLLFFLSCKEPVGKTVHLNKQNFSAEEQIKIGLRIKDEVLSLPDAYPILNQSDYESAYGYVNRLYRTLQNTSIVSHRDTFNWDLHLINDDKTKTAFILPGGHLFIYTGLLKTFNTESELMNFMAHEMYYADRGYAVLRLKEEYSDLGDLLLDDVNPTFMSDLAKDLRKIVYATKEVEKADQFAIELLCPFQYDAFGLKSILEIAEKTEATIDWLAIRPAYEGRKESIETQAQACGMEESLFSERYETFKRTMLPR